MLETALAIPFWLELVATLAGAISGAMSAVKIHYDVFGTVCLACAVGVCGGIMRDVLLQDYGIYAFQNPSLIVGCVVAGLVVFWFSRLVTFLDPVVDFFDNVSVALWAVIGAGKAIAAGLGIVPAAILGTVTAVGGGIMRDVLMCRRPEVFQAGTLYGCAALFGSVVFALMKQNHLLEQWAGPACVLLVLALRYASIAFGWRTSPPHDYSNAVARVVKSPVRAVIRRMKKPKG